MKNKTIIFYINSIRRGGAERVLLELARFFSQSGYRSILVTSFVDMGTEYPVPEGVERISIEQEEQRGFFLVRNIRRVFALRQLCKKYKPVVLISFMGEPNCRALAATIGLPIKIILSVRSNPEREYSSIIHRFFAKCFFLRADGCVFQTESAMRWFPERLQRKSVVILNPVQGRFFQTPRAKKLRNIVAVGRLEKVKNFSLLLEAFSMIVDKYPKENLLIYGQGYMREFLQSQILRLHLEDRAFLMGGTDDVPCVLACAKLFVLSSDSEGLPNALMEAMAMGVPVIATDCPCGGPRMLIEDGVNGRLVPVGDVEQLSKAMDEFLADEELVESMGEMVKKWARERFQSVQVLEKWRQYVETVLKG